MLTSLLAPAQSFLSCRHLCRFGLHSAPWTRLQQCTHPSSVSAASAGTAPITATTRPCSSSSSSTQHQDSSTDAATQAPAAGPAPSAAQQQAPSEPGQRTDGVQPQTPVVSENDLTQQDHGLHPSEHSNSNSSSRSSIKSSSSPGQAWTIVRGRQGQLLGRAHQQAAATTAAAAAAEDAQRSQAGVLRLSGTEQELFSQAISFVPPAAAAAAAAQLSEVTSIANSYRHSRRLPTHKLLETIARVLDLSQQVPDVQLAALLQPVIAAARTRYSLDALLPTVKRMRRVLPDTQLRAALLRRDPADVSRTVSKAVNAFMQVLNMPPPVQLLCAPRAFVGTLTLPPDSLARHLLLLKGCVSSLGVAQEVTRLHTGALLAPSAEQLLAHARDVGQLLGLAQDDAVKLVLRHPHLASSAHQLRLLTALLQELPARLGIDLHQVQSVLVARPNLARYSSPDALVAKVEALSPLFPGASPADLLAVCSLSKVMSGSTAAVAASVRTCTAVMGHANPGPLLPLLLHLASPALAAASADSSDADGPAAAAAGAAKRPYTFLLQPAGKLAARAVALQKLYGLDRQQLAKLARCYPQLVFACSSSTTKLKALLLQLQLLGDGSRVAAGGELAPEVEKMFRTCPQLASLKHQTCVDHLTHLTQLLQLDPGQTTRLVLRRPQLLVYAPSKLAGAFSSLAELVGGADKARGIVLQSPQVLPQVARLQSRNAQLPVMLLVQQLLNQAEQQHQQQEEEATVDVSEAAVAAAREKALAAVQVAAVAAAAAAAAAQPQQQQQHHHHLSDQGASYRGVRPSRHHRWEMRYAGLSQYFGSQIEAGCAYDLACLGSGKRQTGRNRLNFPAVLYSSQQVEAVGQYHQLLKLRRQQRRKCKHTADAPQQQQQQQPAAEGGVSAEQPLLGAWGVAKQLLLSPAGRVLLDMGPASLEGRLHALAGLTGLSVQQVLQRYLDPSSSYFSDSLLRLAPARLEERAAALQALLQLPHADLQGLLCRAPLLLALKTDRVAAKVAALVPAFESCWEAAAVGAAVPAAGSRPPTVEGNGVAWPLADTDSRGMVCLQRAVLHTPALLLLSAAKVAQRMEVLAGVVCGAAASGERPDEGEREQELAVALGSGAAGRWLTAGDAHYAALAHLVSSSSPVVLLPKLAQFFRQPVALSDAAGTGLDSSKPS